jgi:hypothetical protein
VITAKQLKEFLATVEDNALIFIGKSGGMSYGCQNFMVKKELFIEKEDQFLDSLIWDHDFDDEEIEKLEKEAIERQAVYLHYYPDWGED